jgi:hypothetical protein
MKTAIQAAKEIGISTRRFGYVALRQGVAPTALPGTEGRKVPTYVYTPEQVARIAALVPSCDGNGHRKS